MHILSQVPRKCKLRRILKTAIFGSRIACPNCKSRYISSIRQEERWRCRSCHKPFSLKSASWLKGSKLSLETIWLMLWCWQQQIALRQARAIVGVSYPTLSVWYAKFRANIPKHELDTVLSGRLAGDEMYTKTCAIIGAKERGTRNIAMRVIHKRSVDRSDAMRFLVHHVAPGSQFATDGAAIYKGIGNWHRIDHIYELHRKFEFTETSEIEGLWGVFRTFVRRMYHHVTKYKLEEIVAEFCLRFRRHKIFNSPSDYWSVCLSTNPFAL